MKRLLLLALLAIALQTTEAVAQSQWYYYAEEFYFVKEVPVKDLCGKNFRYEIAVKSNPSDTLSKVRIHGINVGKGREDFLHTDFDMEVRSEQDWIIYTLVGTIDPQAFKVWFYTAVNGNGDFYFDDISFYVEMAPGQWKQLQLPNNSFETRSNNIFDGYYVSTRGSKNIQIKLTDETVKSGRKALYVSTRKQHPVAMLSSNKDY